VANTESIIKYIEKYVTLSYEEKLQFASGFKETKIKKRQLVIQPNFVTRHRYFLLDGAMRAYVISDEGREHTIQLAIADWWISDYNSYMFQQPATMFVIAVEDSVALQISYEDEQKLKAANYKFETFFRMIAERAAAFMQRRIINSLTKSAEQRYDLFQEKCAFMLNRFPQYVIASYLGMTTEFLSKIRNKKVPPKS
jgi:CRP-like cAMP-binding protein